MKKIAILSIVCLVSGTLFAQTNAASSLAESNANAVKGKTEMKAAPTMTSQKAVAATPVKKETVASPVVSTTTVKNKNTAVASKQAKMNAAAKVDATSVEVAPAKEVTDNAKPATNVAAKKDQ